MGVDISLFQWFNSYAGVSPMRDVIIAFFGNTFGFFILLGCFIGIFSLRFSLAKSLLILTTIGAAGVAARFIVAELVRSFVHRARPFEIVQGMKQLLDHTPGGSFPSGHAAFYFAVAAALFMVNRRWGAIAGVGALVLGIARVAAGVHWPTDIFGGAIVGVVTGVAVIFLMLRFLKYITGVEGQASAENKGKITPEG